MMSVSTADHIQISAPRMRNCTLTKLFRAAKEYLAPTLCIPGNPVRRINALQQPIQNIREPCYLRVLIDKIIEDISMEDENIPSRTCEEAFVLDIHSKEI